MDFGYALKGRFRFADVKGDKAFAFYEPGAVAKVCGGLIIGYLFDPVGARGADADFKPVVC